LDKMSQMNWKVMAMIAVIAVGGWALVKFAAGKASGVLGEPASVKVGLYNFLIVGVMAMLFILLMKYVTAKYPIPGLTQAAQAV
jgi:hypothetical protein